MTLPRGARLPMLFSAVTGLCVLAAVGYVLIGLLRQHADSGQAAFGSIFALLVFALWLWGFYRSCHFLDLYAREEAAIPEVTPKLTQLAQEVEQRLADGAAKVPARLSAHTSLLDRRVIQVWRSLKRGSPLLTTDMADSEERHFPGPEREIRTVMDIALNVGIAGTFVSILVTLGQPRGLTADTLLAHIGPGMTSGLAAVIANVGLRLCHRAVQDQQDVLAAKVDDTISDYFVAYLPKGVTSPEDRLAAANEQLAQDVRDILEYTLGKQNQATQKALVEQAAQTDGLIKEHARLIGQVLTEHVQQPIELMATHTGVLAQHSGTWAATAADMKTAHGEFLALQRSAQESHAASVATLFKAYRDSLNAFFEAARDATHAAMQESHENTVRQIQEHAVAVASQTEILRAQFNALLGEQEAANRRLTDAALQSLGGVIDARLAAVEDRITATLLMIENRLPDTLRDGLGEALKETTALLKSLREQAGELARAVAQVSGNADRQLLAYERWQERAQATIGDMDAAPVTQDGLVAALSLQVPADRQESHHAPGS